MKLYLEIYFIFFVYTLLDIWKDVLAQSYYFLISNGRTIKRTRQNHRKRVNCSYFSARQLQPQAVGIASLLIIPIYSGVWNIESYPMEATVTRMSRRTRTTPHIFLNFMLLSFSPTIFSMIFFCIPRFIYNWCLAYI